MTGGNVLVFLSSHRKKSNSSILGKMAAQGAAAAGARVETIRLPDLTINPCHGCDYCQTKERRGCVQKDDMIPLYSKLLAADAIVLAGPVYWFSICAQTKLLIDRFYALGGENSHLLADKKIGLILTYGDADPFTSGAVNALRSFQDMFRYIGAEIVDMVYGSAEKAGEIAKKPDLLKRAEALGKALAG